jgi:hypothetical protein
VFIPDPLDLVYTYKLLQKFLLDPKDLLLNDTLAKLHRNPVCDIVPDLIQNLIESSLRVRSKISLSVLMYSTVCLYSH